MWDILSSPKGPDTQISGFQVQITIQVLVFLGPKAHYVGTWTSVSASTFGLDWK